MREGSVLTSSSVYGKIILKLICKKYGVTVWTEFIMLRARVAGSCEHCNTPSGSMSDY
jgi:hypothetical protein